MIVIADTSALIALSICDCLNLLEKLFEKIAISQIVYNECVVSEKPQAKELSDFLRDKIESIDTTNLLKLPTNLGAGEISSMLLYEKLKADFLLIDDNRARKIAIYNNINVIGSLGILLIARRNKLINKITPFLDKLENSELFIDQKLINEIKILAKE